ncbi:MAG: hypothetical protein KKE05_04070, partial [Nanoarchaeota archaeon]|nr:hypothetical protein [Nanoarchaeota archaeon]
MNNDDKIPVKKKKPTLQIISMIAYALGAVFLFAAPPPGVFLSPGLGLPTLGITSPFLWSMILLAATSVVFIAAVFQKGKELKKPKISKETGKFIAKNIEEDVKNISESVMLRKDQTKRDFNKFIYVIGVLSVILALFQAWQIFWVGAAAGVSLIYWGAYL